MEAVQRHSPVENEEFWRNHHQMQKASGLTRSDYSRQHGLNYDRFGYWIKKQSLNKNHSAELISIKVKASNSPAMQSTLCTLNLSSGHHLQIHDISVLSIILDRMS